MSVDKINQVKTAFINRLRDKNGKLLELPHTIDKMFDEAIKNKEQITIDQIPLIAAASQTEIQSYIYQRLKYTYNVYLNALPENNSLIRQEAVVKPSDVVSQSHLFERLFSEIDSQKIFGLDVLP